MGILELEDLSRYNNLNVLFDFTNLKKLLEISGVAGRN
tara:strand:- start:159 stop:272 length:114 start_codon:yes stop_codon:yes gene_type:complete